MKKIAIVYHSGYGHTEVQAKKVLEGVKSVKEITAEIFKVEDLTASPEKLNEFDAIIFGSPTYMGSVSAPFKAFMDATSKLWYKQEWKNKIAAGFTNSHSLSGDKLNSLIQMTIFAAQHAMIWVGQGEMNQSPEGHAGKNEAVNRIGSFLGAMAQSESASPEVTPPSGDLETAKLLGIRVAEITKKFK